MRLLVMLVLLTVGFLPVAAHALPSTEAMLSERSLGDSKAPVVIYEYSSLTCPHCADFHSETLPEIKKEYIDTGKVRYVIRDFPLDNRAMAATMIARCLPSDHYFSFVSLLFKNQETWARSQDPLKDLKILAEISGMPSDEVDQCLHDSALLQGLTQARSEAHEKEKIESTPTFIINGTVVSGAKPFTEFKSVIDAALAKAGQ